MKAMLPVLAFLVSGALASVNAETNPPTNLLPADGASNVSLMPSLSWTWEPQVGCPDGIGIVVFTVYLGSDAANLSPVGLCCNEGWPETVGPLEPDMEYFWRVRVVDEFRDCPGSHEAWSVVQSFRTAASVPVYQTAWHNIKALYR